MDGYIQIGVTALRDPMTGERLEAVPLYIRAEDAGSQARAEIPVGPLAKDLGAKMAAYIDQTEGLPE